MHRSDLQMIADLVATVPGIRQMHLYSVEAAVEVGVAAEVPVSMRRVTG